MSENKAVTERKGFKHYWSKFQALNGSSVFLAMIAALNCIRGHPPDHPGRRRWIDLRHPCQFDDDLPADGL